MTLSWTGFRQAISAAIVIGMSLGSAAPAFATDAIEGDDYFSTDLHPAGKGVVKPTPAPKKQGAPGGEAAASAPEVKGEAASATPAPAASTRVREGTRLVDRIGSFKITGEGVTFFSSDGELRLSGLQNLAMERVARVLRESHSEPEWLVTGVVTEYEGGNFLLLQRAILKTRVNLPGSAFGGAGK